MKKTILKIFFTAAAVLAIALTVILIVTTYGGISVEDYDNAIAKGLITAMGIAYLLLTVFTMILLYMNDEAMKEITLRMGQEGNTRITVGVIKKIAKENTALIEGVKCKKCLIIANEYGIRLKISISIKGKDVEEAENKVRAVLIEAYDKILGYKFHSIEIKVKKLVPETKIDVDIANAILLPETDETTAPVEEITGDTAESVTEEQTTAPVTAEETEYTSEPVEEEVAEETVETSESETDTDGRGE